MRKSRKVAAVADLSAGRQPEMLSVNNLGKGNSTAVMKIFVDDEHDDDDNVVMDGDMW